MPKKYVAPCDPKTRAAALGEDAPEELARCWPCFEKLPAAKRDDWLADGNPGEKDRSGQTLKRFLTPGPHRTFPTRRASRVYLMPLGDDSAAPPIRILADVLQRFLSLEVVPMKSPTAKEVAALPRDADGCGYGPQIETAPAFDFCYGRKPKDAFALISYTMEDICDSSKGFQFLFGQANLDKGVGVFSFARYTDGEPSTARFLRRCAMVLCHEALHLFGIKHCVYAMCLMNGSNHLDESESRPFAICPCCTRKLAITLDQAKLPPEQLKGPTPSKSLAWRAALLEFMEAHSLGEDAAFMRRTIACARGEAGAPPAATAATCKDAELDVSSGPNDGGRRLTSHDDSE